MKEKLMQKWFSFSRQEKFIITGLAGATLMLLIFITVVKPFLSYTQLAQQRQIKAKEGLLWVSEHKNAALAALAGRSQAKATPFPAEYIEKTLKQSGINAVIKDRKSKKPKVEIESTRLNLLLDVLVKMNKERGIVVDELRLHALSETDDAVRVRVVLSVNN